MSLNTLRTLYTPISTALERTMTIKKAVLSIRQGVGLVVNFDLTLKQPSTLPESLGPVLVVPIGKRLERLELSKKSDNSFKGEVILPWVHFKDAREIEQLLLLNTNLPDDSLRPSAVPEIASLIDKVKEYAARIKSSRFITTAISKDVVGEEVRYSVHHMFKKSIPDVRPGVNTDTRTLTDSSDGDVEDISTIPGDASEISGLPVGHKYTISRTHGVETHHFVIPLTLSLRGGCRSDFERLYRQSQLDIARSHLRGMALVFEPEQYTSRAMQRK